MICEPCAQAGSLNTELVRLNSSGKPGKNVKKQVKNFHGDCRGGTWCDCQHFVGHALNDLAIAKLHNKSKPDLEQSPVAVDDVASSG